MKRDMDLVRKILFAMEESDTGFAEKELNIDGYSQEVINHHVFLMDKAGLLVSSEVTTYGKSFSFPEAMPLYLTWEGYDFLEACRDDQRWTKSKDIIKELGGSSFDVLKTVLIELMKNQAIQLVTGV